MLVNHHMAQQQHNPLRLLVNQQCCACICRRSEYLDVSHYTLGLPASVPGPLTPIAGLVINTSLVWLAMPLGALLVRNSKYPMATAPGWGVIAVNILPHIVMTVRAGA